MSEGTSCSGGFEQPASARTINATTPQTREAAIADPSDRNRVLESAACAGAAASALPCDGSPRIPHRGMQRSRTPARILPRLMNRRIDSELADRCPIAEPPVVRPVVRARCTDSGTTSDCDWIYAPLPVQAPANSAIPTPGASEPGNEVVPRSTKMPPIRCEWAALSFQDCCRADLPVGARRS